MVPEVPDFNIRHLNDQINIKGVNNQYAKFKENLNPKPSLGNVLDPTSFPMSYIFSAEDSLMFENVTDYREPVTADVFMCICVC